MTFNFDLRAFTVKFFEILNKGFDWFYTFFVKLFPEEMREVVFEYEQMAYVFYAFLLFMGISFAFRMRKKIFWALVVFAAIMFLANRFVL